MRGRKTERKVREMEMEREEREGEEKGGREEKVFPFSPVPTLIRSFTRENASRPIASSFLILIFRGSSSPILL